MMLPIKEIPLDELRADRIDSLTDIIVCQRALSVGITEYSGGSTDIRLKINQEIVARIEAELERRVEAP